MSMSEHSHCDGPGTCMQCSLIADQKKLDGLMTTNEEQADKSGKFQPRVWIPTLSDESKHEIFRDCINFTNVTGSRIQYLSLSEHKHIVSELKEALENIRLAYIDHDSGGALAKSQAMLSWASKALAKLAESEK